MSVLIKASQTHTVNPISGSDHKEVPMRNKVQQHLGLKTERAELNHFYESHDLWSFACEKVAFRCFLLDLASLHSCYEAVCL